MQATSALCKTVRLNGGHSMPIIGLGTWKLMEPDIKPVLETALELGCRHIDCASIYENEQDVGKFLKEVFEGRDPKLKYSIRRENLFIVSKLWNTKHAYHDVLEACEQSLKDLQLDYLDLYLIHWPFSFESDPKGYSLTDNNGVAITKPVPVSETWKAMEELVRRGKVKAIGVSNFTIKHLKEVLDEAVIFPSVNQVELHPYLPQPELVKFCQDNGIEVVAYSPLGSGKHPSLLEDPTIVRISKEIGLTPAQVLISWAYSRGTGVIFKTSNPKRVKENFHTVFLDAEIMRQINDIKERTHIRFCDPVNWWKRDCFDNDS